MWRRLVLLWFSVAYFVPREGILLAREDNWVGGECWPIALVATRVAHDASLVVCKCRSVILACNFVTRRRDLLAREYT